MMTKSRLASSARWLCIIVVFGFLFSWVAGRWAAGRSLDIWVEVGSRFALLQAKNTVVIGIGNTLGFREFPPVSIDAPVRVNAQERDVLIYDAYWDGF